MGGTDLISVSPDAEGSDMSRGTSKGRDYFTPLLSLRSINMPIFKSKSDISQYLKQDIQKAV